MHLFIFNRRIKLRKLNKIKSHKSKDVTFVRCSSETLFYFKHLRLGQYLSIFLNIIRNIIQIWKTMDLWHLLKTSDRININATSFQVKLNMF